MTKIEVLKKMIDELLKEYKSEKYSTRYGEGYKAGKIEAIEEVFKLLPR